MELVRTAASFTVLCSILAFAVFTAFYHTRDKRYIRWGLSVFLIILAGAFAPSTQIFFIAALLVFIVSVRGLGAVETLAFYLVLLPLVPSYLMRCDIDLPVVGHIMGIEYKELLIVVVLLPILIKTLVIGGGRGPYSRLDISILLAILYFSAMEFRDQTFLSALRASIDWLLLLFLPYFIASRHVKSERDFSSILAAVAFMGFLLGSVGVFETVFNWRLFHDVLNHLVLDFRPYIYRSGFLRATGPFPVAMSLACFLTLTVPAIVYQIFKGPGKKVNYVMLVFVCLGMASTVTSTPWLSLLIFFIAFVLLTYRRKESVFAGLLMVILLLVSLPGMVFLLNRSAIDYRLELFFHSMPVIKRSPLTGSGLYFMESELYLPIEGQSVDLTNEYLHTALQYGLVGLSLYMLIFVSAISSILGSIGSGRKKEDSVRGALLASTLLLILAMMNSILLITTIFDYAVVYLGLAAAHTNIRDNGYGRDGDADDGGLA